jgi:hypothetical protein
MKIKRQTPQRLRQKCLRGNPDGDITAIVEGALTRRRFPGGDQVSRWTVRLGNVPAGAEALVLFSIEELAVNEIREDLGSANELFDEAAHGAIRVWPRVHDSTFDPGTSRAIVRRSSVASLR